MDAAMLCCFAGTPIFYLENLKGNLAATKYLGATSPPLSVDQKAAGMGRGIVVVVAVPLG
jgi:hypothetical protein